VACARKICDKVQTPQNRCEISRSGKNLTNIQNFFNVGSSLFPFFGYQAVGVTRFDTYGRKPLPPPYLLPVFHGVPWEKGEKMTQYGSVD